MSTENPYGCCCNPPQSTGLRPGTIVVIEFPGGVTTEGDCATCGGPIEHTVLREHPGFINAEGLVLVERTLAVAVLKQPAGSHPHISPLEVFERSKVYRGYGHLTEENIEIVAEGWYARGWLECGVSVRTGWLTNEGHAALRALVDAFVADCEAKSEASARRNPREEYPTFTPKDVAAWDIAWARAYANEKNTEGPDAPAPSMRVAAWWASFAEPLIAEHAGLMSDVFEGPMRSAFAVSRVPVAWARAIHRWWIHGDAFWEWYRHDAGKGRS